MRKPRTKSKNRTKWIMAFAFLFIAVFIVGFIAFSPYSPMSYWWIPKSPTTPEADISTFTIYDVCTDEDVSGDVNITVWFPDVDDISNWDEDDYLDLANWKENVSNEIASEVELDLTDIPAIWVEIETANSYANTFWLLSGNGNYEYQLSAGINSDDMVFNIADENLSIIDVSGHQTDGTYLIFYSNLLANTTQMPLYDPDVDTLKDWDSEDPLTYFTDCFGFQFIFNGTIGVELDDPTHVNFTISEDIPALIIYDGNDIYIIFYELVGFTDFPNTLYYTIAYGEDIELTDVDMVRIEIPEGSAGTFTPTKISDIAS